MQRQMTIAAFYRHVQYVHASQALIPCSAVELPAVTSYAYLALLLRRLLLLQTLHLSVVRVHALLVAQLAGRLDRLTHGARRRLAVEHVRHVRVLSSVRDV